MLPTTTRTNNGWESSLPQQQSYTIDFEGMQILTTGALGDSTKLSYDALKSYKRNRTQIEWKIEDSAQYFVDEGFGYIKDLGESNTIGEFLTFSGSIVGFGEPVFTSDAGAYTFEDGEAMLFEDSTGFLFNI
jgi:hypothetical protein